MNNNKEELTLVVEKDIFEKFKYIAKHNGNSFDEEIEKGIEDSKNNKEITTDELLEEIRKW